MNHSEKIKISVSSLWCKSDNTLSRGSAFYQGRCYSGIELASFLSQCKSIDHWKTTVSALNGSFAAITTNNKCMLAVVDHVRSIPIFYALNGPMLCISDNAYWVRDQLGKCEHNQITADEFLLTGYVTGSNTLCEGVKQLQVAEYLHYDFYTNSSISTERYYVFHHEKFLKYSSNRLIDELENVHQKVFERLIMSIGERQVVIPLSAGYDSRLLGVSLKEVGIRNVICYNYGVEGSWESRISRELADYLGFRWIHIPYSADLWKQWSQTVEFRNYFQYAGNLCSVPHVQDWPAVFELKKRGAIDSNGVIVPGHSGDFLAGSHIPKQFTKKTTITRRDLIDSLYRAHYTLWDWPKRKIELKNLFDRRIEAVIGEISDCSPEEAADLFEWWDLQERQAKFICNSLRVYDFFGYEWRLPLFDRELMDYWSMIPIQWRYQRRLYLDFAKERQVLPITKPNTDRSIIIMEILALLEKIGLKPFAKLIQLQLKKINWEKEYENCSYPPLAWYGMLDKQLFYELYSGKETLHSFVAKLYLDSVLSDKV